jgi:hypothetical protein
MLRSLSIIEAFLGSIFHVEHIPRNSTWESDTCDKLSRERTTGFLESQLLKKDAHLKPPFALLDWFKEPRNDWNLTMKLLNHVTELVNKK